MIYLVVHKETFIVHGVFRTEERAKSYMADSKKTAIVYLSKQTLQDIDMARMPKPTIQLIDE